MAADDNGPSILDLVSASFGPPKHKEGELFLKGPIPWKWLQIAAKLPSKSLQISIALWFRAGIDKSREIKLTNVLLNSLGVDRFAKSRGLKHLEQAGLISIKRTFGKNPIIILKSPPEDNSSTRDDYT